MNKYIDYGSLTTKQFKKDFENALSQLSSEDYCEINFMYGFLKGFCMNFCLRTFGIIEQLQTDLWCGYADELLEEFNRLNKK